MTAISRVTLLTALAAIALTGEFVGLAQEPQQPAAPAQPAPVFRTKVELVRVDVSVTGDRDAAVGDLQATDFGVREDGVPQKVETVQFVTLDGTRTSDTKESLEIRSSEHAALEASRDDVRVFAIFLDDYHIDRDQGSIRVRQAMKEFVKHFGPNDLVTVMDPLTPLSALRFTRSRGDLLTLMDKFAGRLGQLTPVRSVLEEAQLTQRNVWEVRGAVTLSALEALVTHLGGLREGRKSVLLVSEGPNMGRSAGENEAQLKAVLQSANRGNVTINAFDPRTLGSAPVGGANVISRLTSETGGRAVVNANDPSSRLAQTIADASAYYLIGYVPARDIADGKFHRIDVKVKRRGLRVLARRGYWSPTAKEMNPTIQPLSAEPGVAEAVAALVEPRETRPVDVWIGLSRGANGLTRLTIAWEPAGRRNGRAPATQLEIDPLVVGARAPVGAHQPSADARTIDSSATAIFEREAGKRAAFRFTARAADGMVVDQWDQSSIVTSLTGAPLVLSTPRFLRARSALEARRLEAEQDPPPAASRRFRQTDRVVVDGDCYVAGGGEASMSARLLNAKGDSLVDLGGSPVHAGTARFRLPLSSLAPGLYVLRIDAHAAQDSVQQRMAFQVVP